MRSHKFPSEENWDFKAADDDIVLHCISVHWVAVLCRVVLCCAVLYFRAPTFRSTRFSVVVVFT